MGQAQLYLIGFMGAGKTTVGEMIGHLTGVEVIDTDEYIEKKENRSVHEIFDLDGEEYFRKREIEALRSVSSIPAIITTGGGIILHKSNRQLLKNSGKTVFLQCHPETVLARLEGDTTRPLLRNKTMQEIIEMYEKRLPLYLDCATYRIDTADLSIEQVADKIIERMKLLKIGDTF